MAHAKFSPSGAPKWLRCPGALSLEEHAPPEEESTYAREGTDAHELAEKLLAVTLSGHDGAAVEDFNTFLAYCLDRYDEDMKDYVFEYSRNILAAAGLAEYYGEVDGEEGMILQALDASSPIGELHIEEIVDFSDSIGLPIPEEGSLAFGTADAVIVFDDRIEVHDLKYGKGVRVSAKRNEQLMIYAMGALEKFDIMGDIDTVKMVIHQVRIGQPDEWECSVQELMTFASDLKRAVKLALSDEPPFYAGEKQCRWCKGKAICQHAATQATGITSPADANDFADLSVTEYIAAMPVEAFEAYYEQLGFIEGWLKAMHARGHTEAMNGTLTNFKAVTGRAGARKYSDPDEAEKVMKSMRLKLDEMYNKKIISPTQAEKLLKDSPRKWVRLEPLIVKPEGKPTVVPIGDKRPALSNSVDDGEFDDLNADDDLA